MIFSDYYYCGAVIGTFSEFCSRLTWMQDNLSFLKVKVNFPEVDSCIPFILFLPIYVSGLPQWLSGKEIHLLHYEIDSITDSMDINLSKLQEVVEEHAIVHEVTKRWSQLRD